VQIVVWTNNYATFAGCLAKAIIRRLVELFLLLLLIFVFIFLAAIAHDEPPPHHSRSGCCVFASNTPLSVGSPVDGAD
jgi:hypothetical protein